MIKCRLPVGADPNMSWMDDYEQSSAFLSACKGSLKLKYEEYMPRDYAEAVIFSRGWV
jgi:hypothetical protein